TTFGLKAAGWRSLVLDARDRVARVRDALPVQLGGAAGTLAAFAAYGAEDPAALVTAYARELGLRAPLLPWHTLRTPVADLAGCLAFTAGALGKTAADVLTLCRTEIAELAEGSGGGSSAMPHKANPVRSTLIAAAARRAPQLAATLYASMAAEDERPAGAWHAEWEP
ncbi:3-carboxy-cis,cis-muconate cycloisomerase, partial [Streptomyces sp. SID625]|nr:3-carboxy-cis,cis-muconate cycloisomerase [Streptomyces sp. SID625]